MTLRDDTRQTVIIRIGGLSLIAAAVLFLGVFSYLASQFNYPEVLDGKASEVLPALLQTGQAGRAVWALYAVLPLVWVPAAVGAFQALRIKSEGVMRLGILFAVISAIAMILGLVRWPSLHWELARAWLAEPDARPALEAVFNGTNRYLGNYIGEFLGELCFSMFFLLSAAAMLKAQSGFPRWIGWLGVVTGTAGLIGMFRNVTSAVATMAELNNYLLPVWMIVFGIALLRYGKKPLAPLTRSTPVAA